MTATTAEAGAITIRHVNSNFERELLLRPFGFKGGYLSELWQTVALLESEAGHRTIGLGTQSVLWSDASIFATHSEAGGNVLMYALLERALKLARGRSFNDPIELLEAVLPEVYAYGKKITDNPGLRKTFALNALVGFDNAAWLLYAQHHGIRTFDELIPEPYRPALSHRHDRVASMAVVGYGTSAGEMEEMLGQGYFMQKVKLGAPGTQEEMLEQDKRRVEIVHRTLGGHETEHTADGRLPYYFDANGRYENKETLQRLLDHAAKIGALDRIAVIEEPFPEEYEVDVRDLGVRIAADESSHTYVDAQRRIDMGYGAIALKPVAKTLSMTLKTLQVAHEAGIPCFCADLTVNPVLLDWNVNVAARLAPFPGLSLGLIETNGHQNYRRWAAMQRYHPRADALWKKAEAGVFSLDGDFYTTGGGIFDVAQHYVDLVQPNGTH